ncbi:unnamed protein product [Schistocephalus solidus]|uniref:Uncharacterized protein n=1 Tax=Schistocephalus solidus TaxID=70667 RepID=A0A183SUJ0_SCHSO|nr:unnamed protein product [Schistocephalus solidus]
MLECQLAKGHLEQSVTTSVWRASLSLEATERGLPNLALGCLLGDNGGLSSGPLKPDAPISRLSGRPLRFEPAYRDASLSQTPFPLSPPGPCCQLRSDPARTAPSGGTVAASDNTRMYHFMSLCLVRFLFTIVVVVVPSVTRLRQGPY